jgi:putative ABC transport system permease protein
LLLENTNIALQAIRSQKTRTAITALIIAIGLMALVGILSAIDAIKQSIANNFAAMGANTFTIRNRGINIGGPHDVVHKKDISFAEAMMFCNKFNFPQTKSSISYAAKFDATLKYLNQKTNPNIRVFGVNENYFATSGLTIEYGRGFTATEINGGYPLIVIGSGIASKLFGNSIKAVAQTVNVGSYHYKVVGVLQSKGSGMGFSTDNSVYISIYNARQYYNTGTVSYTISVMTHNIQQLPVAISEATSEFRRIRKVPLNKENNFDIIKSDSLASKLMENISFVTLAATVIGFITLLGASISLMNIMLVSVTERTREIGIRKSIGATPQVIKAQFLTEAILICLMGGVAGIALGVIIGNAVSLVIGGSFIIPWVWISVGLFLCVAVGVIAGYYPAAKASKLDPVEALRYE